jgi:hypothetical protein
MPDEPLKAHSLAEAQLYLMATPCASCGHGPLKGSDAKPAGFANGGGTAGCRWQVTAVCDACQSTATVAFLLPNDHGIEKQTETTVVNPTDEPSRILDVGQWIVLFRMIIEATTRETDKIQARHLGIEAAQCLEEALKFYDDVDNDLPPSEAFFTGASRERFRDAPEQFSKRRLIGLRAKLPSMKIMRRSIADRGKKRWWRRRR